MNEHKQHAAVRCRMCGSQRTVLLSRRRRTWLCLLCGSTVKREKPRRHTCASQVRER